MKWGVWRGRDPIYPTVFVGTLFVLRCRGASLIRNRPPPKDPPRTLGTGLRYGPRGVRFLVSEVPLYQPKTYNLNPQRCTINLKP